MSITGVPISHKEIAQDQTSPYTDLKSCLNLITNIFQADHHGSDPAVLDPFQCLNVAQSLGSSSEAAGENKKPATIRRFFSCKYCNKKLSSLQALGGHQNGHKHERAAATKKDQLICIPFPPACEHYMIHHHLILFNQPYLVMAVATVFLHGSMRETSQ